jgi:hypothetical protein
MYVWLNMACGCGCRVEKPQAPSTKGNCAVFTLPEGASLFQPTLCIWLGVCVVEGGVL